MTDKATRRDIKSMQALFPPAKRVELAEGVEIDIGVLSSGQLVKIAKILAPALVHLRGLDGIKAAMFEHPDLLASATAIAIGWEEDDFLALPPEAFIRAIDAVVEANVAHFEERIAPALERLFAAATAPAESEAAS
jgi:hypothetical protein